MPTPNHSHNRYHQVTKNLLILLCVALLLVMHAVSSATAGRAAAAYVVVNGASVWLDGPVKASTGETISYDIMTDASGLYGTQLELSFDPAILQIVGTEITPGSCPAPDFVPLNSVDNSAGTIAYAASSLNPTTSCDGGIVASFQFQVLPTATQGSTQVQFKRASLADVDGAEIPATAVNLDLEITGVTAEFSGTPVVGPPPLIVDFTNLSSGDYTSCTWDFGDNSGSSLCANQSHVYTDPGVYTVSLTISGPDGSDSEVKVDYIVVWKSWVYLPVVLR